MNYLVPVNENYPAVIGEQQSNLTDIIINESQIYQFPVCNTMDFNLDNAYGLKIKNLNDEFQKDCFFNSYYSQICPQLFSLLSNFCNYDGNLVICTGNEILADEVSLEKFLDSQNKLQLQCSGLEITYESNQTLQLKLWLITLLLNLITTLRGLLPEFTDRFIKPHVMSHYLPKIVPQYLQLIKAEFLMRILKEKSELFYSDNRDKLQTYLKRKLQEIELIVHINQYQIKSSTPLKKLTDVIKPNIHFTYLFKTLFALTEGKIKQLDDLSITIAKIVAGRQIIKNELHLDSGLTIIKTSNLTFMLQFFSAISDFNFLKTIKHRGGNNRYSNIITQMNDIFNFQRGNYNSVSNLNPIRETQIFSNYSASDLSNTKRLGKLIENDIKGNLFNVFCDTLTDSNVKTISNLVKGNPIKNKIKYLGEQSYTSNSHYIQLIQTEKEISNLLKNNKVPFQVIELETNVPKNLGLFENGEGFDYHQILWFWTLMSIHGLKLLKEKKNISEKGPANMFTEFLEKAVTVNEYSDDVKSSNHINAVPFMTIGKMYNLFLEIVYNIKDSKVEIDKNFIKDHIESLQAIGYNELKYNEVQNAPVRKNLKKLGYSEQEIPAEKAQHIFGLCLKSKEDLILTFKITKKFNETAKRHPSLPYEKFINYLLFLTKEELGIDC